jgi:hypothetical protein
VCSETLVAYTSKEGIWLESKVGEQGVLTWEGRDTGEDPFVDNGEAAVPSSRDAGA